MRLWKGCDDSIISISGQEIQGQFLYIITHHVLNTKLLLSQGRHIPHTNTAIIQKDSWAIDFINETVLCLMMIHTCYKFAICLEDRIHRLDFFSYDHKLSPILPYSPSQLPEDVERALDEESGKVASYTLSQMTFCGQRDFIPAQGSPLQHANGGPQPAELPACWKKQWIQT